MAEPTGAYTEPPTPRWAKLLIVAVIAGAVLLVVMGFVGFLVYLSFGSR